MKNRHWHRHNNYIKTHVNVNKNIRNYHWCRHISYIKVHIKPFSFRLSRKDVERAIFLGKFFGIIFMTAFVAYAILNNLVPFGATVKYASYNESGDISELGPENRVKTEMQDVQRIIRQEHDLAYFTTKMPLPFDKATVRLTFRNPNPTQPISLGFQDQEIWHYNAQLIDDPVLNSLEWQRIGENPVLYQKVPNYQSITSFLANPPKDAIIGTYNYDTNIGKIAYTKLIDYKTAREETTIDTHLRGKIIIYVYLEDEPFEMKIQKQDLNWYDDPDTVSISVYKNNSVVYQIMADDDGITDNSKRVLPPQEITIKNPGPGLPESGVYKVVIDASMDTIIKRISSNLHKIVFQGSIFPTKNSEAYRTTNSSTSATTVYSNSLVLSATTSHTSGLQDISIGNELLSVNQLKQVYINTPKDNFVKVVIPKNDVILNGYFGYFAFSPDQFFQPTEYRIVPISRKEDLELADYILTNYIPSKKHGEWQVAEREFNLQSAFIQNGKLRWVVKAPDLQNNDNDIIIKSIEITFRKDPWF